jgi:hypothetical protein
VLASRAHDLKHKKTHEGEKQNLQAIPRLELGLRDSESRVITTTLYGRDFSLVGLCAYMCFVKRIYIFYVFLMLPQTCKQFRVALRSHAIVKIERRPSTLRVPTAGYGLIGT